MANPVDQVTVPRRELEDIASDIKAVEALLDVQKELAVRSQRMLARLMQRETLQ
jgi:hypothetical protein